MASELRVNTLKDASGNNSVATSTVANGSAKAFGSVDQAGSQSVLASFNISSIDDVATNATDFNYTSSFSSVNYCITGCTATTDGGGQSYASLQWGYSNTGKTTSDSTLVNMPDSSGAGAEGEIDAAILGDLA